MRWFAFASMRQDSDSASPWQRSLVLPANQRGEGSQGREISILAAGPCGIQRGPSKKRDGKRTVRCVGGRSRIGRGSP